MRSLIGILATSFVLILLLGVSTSYAATFGPSQGSVQYKVTVNVNSAQPSILPINNASGTINETVRPASQSGLVNLTLELGSSLGNFTYSRNTNSSALPEIFPVLPTLTNHSFSYQFQAITLNINLANTGQAPVTFNGTNYQATKYTVTFTAQNQTSTLQCNGTIIAMPSGLIYNAELTVNQTATISVTLLSTDLSLNSPSNGINPLGASLVGVAVIGAVVVAAPVIFRAKRKTSSNQKQESQDKVNPYDVD